MDPDELFKRFFGSSPSFPEPRYRGYGHNNDEGEGQWAGEWHGGVSGGASIFGDLQQEMQRQMDAMDQQMRDVFRIFRISEIPSVPALPGGSEPGAEVGEGRSPRDFMLKDGGRETIIAPQQPPSVTVPGRETPPGAVLPSHDEDQISSLFDRFFGVPRWSRVQPQEKRDSDLDGETPCGSEIVDLFKGGAESRAPAQAPVEERRRNPFGFFGHNSVSIRTTIGADGVVEERRTVRDSSGREETSVTRRLGDSSHTVTKVTDEVGRVEKQETYNNVNKDKLHEFDDIWQSRSGKPTLPVEDTPAPKPPLSNDTRGIFRRLFGFDSK